MPLTDREVRELVDDGAPVDRSISAIASRQEGVVSTPQLRLIGLSSSAISRRLACGRLHPLFRGVHAVGHPAVSRRGWYVAGLLAAGPAATLSHRSAAELWRLLPEGDGDVDVTVTGTTGRRRAGLIAHRSRLAFADVGRRDGLPVTRVARTLLDLAELLSVGELVAVIDRAEAERIYDAGEVADVISRSTGRRGLRGLRDALLIARPEDLVTRSELERRALRVIADHGIPRPEVNARVLGFELDLVWRDRRLAVELDGRLFHDTEDAFERDRRRDVDLLVAGWRVVRFTWRRVVYEPAEVTAMIEGLLALEPFPICEPRVDEIVPATRVEFHHPSLV